MNTLLSIFFVLLILPLQADEKTVISLSPGDKFPNELVAAISSVNAGRANVIKFAPGRFEIKHPLEFRLPFGHPGLRLQGAGPGLTQLIFHTADAGIRAHLDTGIAAMKPNPSFLVEDLSLLATGRCGTAIEIRPGDPDHRGGVAPKVFRNLTIEGSKGSWTAGITADDLAFCTFRDLTLRLPKNASTGIHLTGKNAPVDHHFDGIRIISSASSGVLQGNLFSALDTGIRLGERATELTPTNSAFKNTATQISR